MRLASDHDRLQDVLRRQVRAAREEVLKPDGELAPDRLARLESLARLVNLSATTSSPASRNRWLLAAALLSTLLLASALFFTRVRETDVELDLLAEQVSFRMPVDQVLSDVITVSAIGASGLARVRLPLEPGTGGEPADGIPAGSMHLASLDRGGALSLASLAVPAGTLVTLQQTSIPKQYRLRLHGRPLTLRIDGKGSIRIALDGSPPQHRQFESPRSVMAQGDSSSLDLDLTLVEEAGAAFLPQLQASDLAFSRIDDFRADSQTLVRRLSTIVSGTLFFEALDGLAYSLRPGERLRFEGASGVIRTLELRDQKISLRFQGSVRGMRTGWGDADRNLMPTYLSWLKARHGLYLLWGTTLYLFGLIASMLRWWGVRI